MFYKIFSKFGGSYAELCVLFMEIEFFFCKLLDNVTWILINFFNKPHINIIA